jgi:hypothetical protein
MVESGMKGISSYAIVEAISNIFFLTTVTPSPNSTKNEVLLRVYESALVFRRAKGSSAISIDLHAVTSVISEKIPFPVLFCRAHGIYPHNSDIFN